MKDVFVLTAIGADKPGLVELLSRTLSACGANWEESRMARLGGRFAGILLATVDRDRATELEHAVGALAADGLRVTVERTEHLQGTADCQHLRVELVGQDHPGIVANISRALAERRINVEELNSTVESAAMAGHTIFRMTVDVASPPSANLAELRTHLESLAGDLMVDITLRGAAGE